MKSSTMTLLPLLTITAACGGSGSGQPAEPAAASPSTAISVTSVDETAVLNKIYDSEYAVPQGFFIDERVESTTRSYTVHHVLDASASYELCSDDLVEAQQWEAADNAARAVNGYFVTSIENDRYFEFVRELAYDADVGNVSEPTSPGYARVFKCSYADRNGVDRALLDGYSGRLSMAPSDATEIRDFVEYLWQFRFFDVSRKVILESRGNGPNQHILQLALLVNQGTGQCDRVDVVDWQFTRNPDSGDTSKRFVNVHSFETSNENGTPRLCK